MMLALMTIFAAIFLSIALFLGSEFLKKFKFMQSFAQGSSQIITWKFTEREGERIGMRNIVLKGGKPFAVLVGFKLNIPMIGYSGFDYYGYAKSDSENKVVISTYIGKERHDYQFLVSANLDANNISVSSSENDQALVPQSSYPPHWYQRLGFYG